MEHMLHRRFMLIALLVAVLGAVLAQSLQHGNGAGNRGWHIIESLPPPETDDCGRLHCAEQGPSSTLLA